MDHPGNPLHEGASTAARGFTEVAVATAMLVEYLRRSRELAAAADAHRQLEDATRIELEQRRADARDQRARARSASQWQLALDRGWMRTANVDEVVHVWACSLPWQREDVRAMQSKRLAEERLDRLDPDLMRRYRAQTAQGLDPLTAMINARREPPPRPHQPVTWPDPTRQVGPVPEPWEAGPAIAGALPRGVLLELEPPGPWPMGPIGWADTERWQRDAGDDRIVDTARADLAAAVDAVEVPAGAPGGADRVTGYASSLAETRRRPVSGTAASTAGQRAGGRDAGEGVARVRRQRR